MKKEIDIAKKPTQKQIEMLRNAAAYPVTEEDEYPEFSEEELLEFHKISKQNSHLRQKQTVTLRLSPIALKKAKSLGKGYTSVLSRILENTLENPKLIEKYL